MTPGPRKRSGIKNRTRYGLIHIVLTVGLVVAARAQHLLRVDSIAPPSVTGILHVTFLVPADAPPEDGFPVLYLLHGYGGDHTDWTSRTRLQDYVSGTSLLIVMPEAKNSWYVNSFEREDLRFEDYIVSDLQAFVQDRFPVDTTRRAIAGLSMGGYGALMLSMRHPGLFSFSGSLSGAIVFPGDIAAMQNQRSGGSLLPSLYQAFGKEEEKRRRDYDLFELISASRQRYKGYVYLVAGIQDGFSTFLPAHRTYADSLRLNGYVYEYHETNGGHNWKFWDREIQPLLRRLQEVLEY